MGYVRGSSTFALLTTVVSAFVGCGSNSTAMDAAFDANTDTLPARDGGTEQDAERDCRIEGCPTHHVCVQGVCTPQTDEDLDGIIAAVDCDDGDPEVGTQASRPCERGCGTGIQPCERGAWGTCQFPESSLESLVDDFGDGEMGALWTSWGSMGTVLRESGGLLVAALPPDQVSSAGYGSQERYEFRGSCATLEIERMLGPEEVVGAYLVLRNVARETVEFLAYGRQIGFRVRDENGEASDIPGPAYDAGAHRFWRIRERDGTVFWETSSDGRDFQVLAAQPSPLSSTEVQVFIGAQAYEAAQDPGELHVDGINVPVVD